MKKTIFTLALLALPAFLCSEVITFADGTEKSVKSIKADEKNVTTENGDVIPRDSVSFVRFSQNSSTLKQAANTSAGTDEAKARGDELFKRANYLKGKYPDAQALILDDYEYITYFEDGKTRANTRYAVMILKDEAKKEFSSALTVETKGRSTSEIKDAVVYCPGGKTYAFDPTKVQRAEPQSGEKFFDAGNQYVIYQFPGVETGCIVDYKTETYEYNPYEKDFFFPSWSFQSFYPSYASEIDINLPENMDLNYSLEHFKEYGEKEISPDISKKDGFKTYSFKLADIKPIIKENDMPPTGDVALSLKASLLGNWDEIFAWTNKLYKQNSTAGDELKNFTLNLIKDSKTDEEKTAKIYHYVQKEIRYIAIKVGVGSGIGGYDANLTWKRKWGCCVDKALLFTAMLNVAGIKSSPILLSVNVANQFDPKIPAIEFDHAISVVYLDGKKIFLDSTNYDYKFPEIASFDYGVNVLNIFANKVDFITPLEPKENAGFYDNEIFVDTNGTMDASEKMSYSGSREAEIRGYYRRIKDTERKQIFEEMAKEASPIARLVDYSVNNADEIEKPFYMTRKYSAENYVRKAGDILIFKIPDFELTSSDLSESALEKRVYPIQREVPVGSYSTYKISLPKNSEIIYMPENKKFSDKYFSFKAGCEKKSETEILCSRSLERKTMTVPPKDYDEYKKLMEQAATYAKKGIFFKTAGK